MAGRSQLDRLAKAGLCKNDKQQVVALGQFIDGYLAQRLDLKPGTLTVMRQARRHLVRFLGESTSVGDVTKTDADAYRADLFSRKLARSTINKWCRYARHFFAVAKRRGLIDDNPFGHIKGQAKGSDTNRLFIPPEDVLKIIEVAPDPQWKLLIALARWGGLRIPSEALTMTWGDVDFERRRITVRSPKTEHHNDGGVRVVPMFPELEPLLQAVYDAAPDGTEHVISRYRDPAANLRTQFVRYVEAAGLKPWPKPWQNLRVSRATELADEFPSHACTAWLGHSEKIANEFYRQVTDDHFARAVQGSNEAVRKAVRGGGAGGSKSQKQPAPEGNRAQLPAHKDVKVGETGFEPVKA